jgi:hypothetical protein
MHGLSGWAVELRQRHQVRSVPTGHLRPCGLLPLPALFRGFLLRGRRQRLQVVPGRLVLASGTGQLQRVSCRLFIERGVPAVRGMHRRSLWCQRKVPPVFRWLPQLIGKRHVPRMRARDIRCRRRLQDLRPLRAIHVRQRKRLHELQEVPGRLDVGR